MSSQLASYLFEWGSFLVRWLHVVAAIAWIGASFYFVWLDNSLEAPSDDALKNKGVTGELWAVHGGGFYNPQKYLVAPKQLPAHLHWFYWESYTTWISGFALLTLTYLFNARAYLIDPRVFPMVPALAIGLALAFLILGWAAYDTICRLFGRNNKVVAVLVALYIAAASGLASQIFAGRAVFLLVGAMMATMMTGNVLMVIIPGQRRTVASMREGRTVDPRDGQRGKQRSVHNTYLTLPVLFSMLSHHSSSLYSHKWSVLILLAMMAAGAVLRHFFVLRHKGQINLWILGLGLGCIGGVILAMAPNSKEPGQSPGTGLPTASLTPIDFAQVQTIITTRCVPCHSAHPTLLAVAPQNLMFNTPEQIKAEAWRIVEQSVHLKIMPPGNITGITDAERDTLKGWFESYSSQR